MAKYIPVSRVCDICGSKTKGTIQHRISCQNLVSVLGLPEGSKLSQEQIEQATKKKRHEYYISRKDEILQLCRERYANNKEYINERSKKYRKENSDKVHSREKEYRSKMAEKIKLSKRASINKKIDQYREMWSSYYKSNRAACLYKSKQYAASHPEVRRKSKNKWKENNRERALEAARKYMRDRRINNPEFVISRREYQRRLNRQYPDVVNARNNKRRAMIMSIGGENYTSVDVKKAYSMQNGMCANYRCGKFLNGKYDVDHIIPICRKGSNGPENIQLLCPRCNQRKNSKTMEEFLKVDYPDYDDIRTTL